VHFLTEEVQSLCLVLLKFDNDKEAANLQKLLSDLIQDMDNAKHEIWTVDLMQQTQMVRCSVYVLDLHKYELCIRVLSYILCHILEMNSIICVVKKYSASINFRYNMYFMASAMLRVFAEFTILASGL
jgi:hypothetical protein